MIRGGADVHRTRAKRVAIALLAVTWLRADGAAAATGGGALAWFPGPCGSSPALYGGADDEARMRCPGDCDGDGMVDVGELVSVVGMAIDGSPPVDCLAVDRDSSCHVSADEAVLAVNRALKGCPPPVPATRGVLSPFVDFLVDSSMVEQGPGAVVLVAQDGEVVHEVAYGLADLQDGRPNRTDTLFAIGQVSMPFTALAVLMLAEDGLVDLDDPIGLYLPRLERFGERLTIRRLLSHTAGVPDFLGRFAGYGQGAAATGPTNDDLIDLLWWWGELQFQPGATCRQSQLGYEVLATLVETVSGVDFARFVAERILAPLEMENTYVRPDQARRSDPPPARGYVPFETNDFFPFDSPQQDQLYGSASMYSTARDLLRFDQALYTDLLVSTETLREAFSPAVLDDGTPACAETSSELTSSIGLGWRIGAYHGEPYTAYDGYQLGYSAKLLRFPERRLTVIVLANRSDSGLPDLAFEIATVFLRE